MNLTESALTLTKADRVWHLNQAPLVRGLPESDLEALAALCQDRIFGEGEVIFRQGQPADSLFILNRGCVRISVLGADGKEKILTFCTAGDVFGENALAAQEYFCNQAAAHEESWVSVISRNQFLALIQKRPPIALSYMKVLTDRLRDAQEEIELQSFLDTRNRLQTVLLRLAERHGRLILGQEGMVMLKIPLTHEQLARLIGANRPHVSALVSALKKKGWIGYRARKLLINIREMRRAFITAYPRTGLGRLESTEPSSAG